MRLEKLYERLKGLVHEGVTITLRDNISDSSGKPKAEVCLQLAHDEYHWVVFEADTLEDALRKAIGKLRHPKKNYVDEHGKVWKAKESSVYSTEHIKPFLRVKSIKRVGLMET